ncbi:hypothetical protein LCGC14_0586000 [marine sediment metagenome]|uniref:Uncharacterized protein n=1 Tax=marine sediment metagenome TaxID=412755 RepID=A0A0F9RJZ5_9ZZZZ
MENKSLTIEKRFLKGILASTMDDLNYLINLIKKFESEFKHDLVNELTSMIDDRDYEGSFNMLAGITIDIYAEWYLKEKCNLDMKKHERFFETVGYIMNEQNTSKLKKPLVLDIEPFRQEFEINLDFWDEFVEALNTFINK